MLGRDKLTVALLVTAGIAAIAAVVLHGRPEHIATVTGVVALTARSGRMRCLDRRRARRQRRSDMGVMSSADYVREQARSSAQRIAELRQQVDQQGLQIEAVYSYLASRARRASAGGGKQAGPAHKLRLVTDAAEDEAG